MPRRRARVRSLLAVIGGLTLATACNSSVDTRAEDPATAGTPAYGDTFIQASIGDIGGLIPSLTSDQSSHEVGGLIYDGLIKLDKDLNMAPAMAESWTYSPDCLDLTFKLRKDVKWHDGHPFTADDVVFTYQTMINPKTPAPFKEGFLLVKDVQAPDPYTVRVRYDKPYARAVETWGTYILPKHLLQSFADAGTLRESPQNSRPIGTGPYRFQEWKPGEKVVLTANPDYFEGRPYLSRIVYRVIPSQATIFLELKAQGVDYVSTLTGMQYSRQTEYPAFRKAYNKFRYPASDYTFLGFNLKDPRFADRRVREAFAHAINKQELIDGVRLGLAREANGPIRPGTWAYTEKVEHYDYDPEKAKALLAEAGWKDRDGDGVVEDKDGKPFTLTIRTNQGNDERKKIAEITQQRLKEVGINADIQLIEWAAFIKEFVKPRRFEVVVLGLGTGTDPDQFVVWHSSQRGPDQMNRTGYANPEVDALLEAGRSSCVQSERVRSYHRIQEILAHDLPMIFLYFRDALPVVASRIHGVSPAPAGILYNFDEWYVPKTQQRYTSG
ncbi:MAG TPA: peptide-binding protein [Methylomirabilota bacterium]|jgi:peptide/nickel transport system substrate-binding protein|nr:peptide-binding protein [Methylomirabilota bacterium]